MSDLITREKDVKVEIERLTEESKARLDAALVPYYQTLAQIKEERERVLKQAVTRAIERMGGTLEIHRDGQCQTVTSDNWLQGGVHWRIEQHYSYYAPQKDPIWRIGVGYLKDDEKFGPQYQLVITLEDALQELDDIQAVPEEAKVA